MDYIINPSWFYWINVVQSAKILSAVACGISLIAMVILLAAWITERDCWDDDDERTFKRMFRSVVVAAVVFTLLTVFIPTRNMLIEMQVARFATYSNAEWTVDAIKSAVDYVIDAIQSLK